MSEPRSLSLPAAAVRELPDLEDVLQSAAYKPFFDYEICVDQDVINKMTPFARHLPPPVDDTSRFEVRVTVIRFDKPAMLPIPPQSTAIIVPLGAAGGGAKIAGQPLGYRSYWVITKEEQVKPEFGALMFLFRKS